MKWRKSNSRAITKFTNWIFLVSLFVAHGPTNHIGQCTPIRNEFNFSSTLKNESQRLVHIKPSLAEVHLSKLEYITDPEYQLVTGTYAVFEVISFIISTTILLIILTYLNNGVSIAKECILLYLYRDVVIAWMSLSFLWFIRMILCYFTSRGLGIGEIQAKVISFLTVVLLLYLSVIMNVISIIKFYAAKKVMLDPPMPWGDNESLGFKIIRFGCIASGILLALTTHLLGYYPKLYYFFNTLQLLQNPSTFRTKLSIFFRLIFVFDDDICIICPGREVLSIKEQSNCRDKHSSPNGSFCVDDSSISRNYMFASHHRIFVNLFLF